VIPAVLYEAVNAMDGIDATYGGNVLCDDLVNRRRVRSNNRKQHRENESLHARSPLLLYLGVAAKVVNSAAV